MYKSTCYLILYIPWADLGEIWGASLVRNVPIEAVNCTKLTSLKHFTRNAAKNFINSLVYSKLKLGREIYICV